MSSSRRKLRFWISAWLPVVVGIAVIVIESTEYFGADRTSGPFRWLFQSIFGPVSDAHWLRAWRMTLPSLWFLIQAALALLGTGMLASWDEWHQSFLPNRTSSPWDVLLDCCGAFVLLSIARIVMGRFSSAPSSQPS